VASKINTSFWKNFDLDDRYSSSIRVHDIISYIAHISALTNYPEEDAHNPIGPFPLIPTTSWNNGELCGNDGECKGGNCAQILDMPDWFSPKLSQIWIPKEYEGLIKHSCFDDAFNAFQLNAKKSVIEGFADGFNEENIDDPLYLQSVCDGFKGLYQSVNPLEVFRATLLDCYNAPQIITVHFGFALKVGIIYKGTILVALTLNGEPGCVVTACEGFGLNAIAGASVIWGIGIGKNDVLEGEAWAIDGDIDVGFGAGVGVAFAPGVGMVIQGGLGGGWGLNALTISQ